jgi:bifunctional non-homologous end joining protein LigD
MIRSMPVKARTKSSHPSTYRAGVRTAAPKNGSAPIAIPNDVKNITLQVGGKEAALTNLLKVFWAEDGITKANLLQYYASIASYLLPHLESRAMVLKRYPDGASGKFFFQKHAPESRPDWIPTCEILHPSANLVDFPVINDVAGLLWAVNLGCIDLNPWYARCDDVDRPDYLHFDLDPTPGADFALVREAALVLRDELDALKIKSYPKTTGSRGIHIYIPIVRGPLQKEVWTFAKAFSLRATQKYPKILTSEYRVAKRSPNRILVDYNQNAWGRTLASVYSVRPKPHAPVSAPVTWKEIERGVEIADFRIDTMAKRLAKVGDLYQPLLDPKDRFKLTSLL